MKKAKYIKAIKNSSSNNDNFTVGQIYIYETSDMLHVCPTIPYKFKGDNNVTIYVDDSFLLEHFEVA